MIPFPPVHPHDEETVRAFSRYEGVGEHGYVTDFLGVKTSISIFSGIAPYSGMVEGYPFPCNFHANAIEWGGVLRSVVEAKGTFVGVELGAGWGPWLVTGAVAAQQKGISKIHLVGVEGSTKHFEFMRGHFRVNGLNPDDHTLVRGVVGTYDGIAKFPVITETADDWGAQASYRNKLTTPPQVVMRGPRWLRPLVRALRTVKQRFAGNPNGSTPTRIEKVPCWSIATLLKPFERVDLVHVDIQGAEYDVIASARRVLRDKVRRLVIGTHGRFIEERLMNELASQGWLLESEEACVFTQTDGVLHLHRDGCQVWSNRQLGHGTISQDRRAAA